MKRLFTRESASFKSPTALPAQPAPDAVPNVPCSNPGLSSSVGLQSSLILPPVPHPHPHEQIAIVATDEGLFMRPHVPGLFHQASSHVRVSWGKHPAVRELRDDIAASSIDWSSGIVVYGIIGILDLFNASHLLVITTRSYIGSLLDENHSIYGVKSVHAIPLIRDRARRALHAIASRIAAVQESSQIPNDDAGEELSSNARVKFADETDVRLTSSTIEPEDDIQVKDEESSSPLPSSGTSTPMSGESVTSSHVVKTIADRMSFWPRLSSRKLSSTEDSAVNSTSERPSLDSVVQSAQGPEVAVNTILAMTAPPPDSAEERHSELEDRVVRECIKEYNKGCMYFAYHFDLTRSLQHKQEQYQRSHVEENLLAELNALPERLARDLDSSVDALAEPCSTLPLWRRVCREFWWNEWLSKPFIDAGLHSYVLPIVQGHFQVSSFEIPTESYMSEQDSISPVDYIIASRRSRYRAGLRYQRRGVDEEAHAANFVETETIMRIKRNGNTNIFSFVQIRGSVPLFWSQSGYSMKPPPVLSPECTPEQNLNAMRRHLQSTIAVYGPHTIVNLAEQTGKESALANAYRSYVSRLDNKDISYCEYDFHHETRGMKYEKIARLVDDLARSFESQGYFWISDRILLSKQKGVFRVNCIDCLDRTNVVQSAFARHVLGNQFRAVGLNVEPHNGLSGMDTTFNDVWANNGDAISRAYAGTSALKGDFTRTGKRDLGGLLNDGVNSLARMYSATFGDWFCQAVIDFMLGYRNISVFSEFLLKLQSTDPQELLRLSRIRTEAIATSVSRVLSEGEPLLAAWTLFAPEQLNTKISDKFEEKVLLLSARALYIVSYDYSLEKVKAFTRIPLGMITKITKGAYILSPLEEASRDPVQNAGFSVTWFNSDQVDSRASSYSYKNSPVYISPRPTIPSERPASGHNKVSSSGQNVGRLFQMMHVPGTSKSRITGNRVEGANDTLFAAFKAIPVDTTRVRSGSRYAEPANDLADATTCREVIDIIVNAIKRACEDVGSASDVDFVSEEDIVSVSEAQRMTSVYAKMEYGVKRLLWLGG